MEKDCHKKMSTTRKGCKDIWNAFMAADAIFCEDDIPLCPTTAQEDPKMIIDWKEAKEIYRKHMRRKERDFFLNAFVCFYTDDDNFDGRSGIWFKHEYAHEVLSHFAGVITPDFSTNQDFPIPWKTFNTYRMRLYGYWLGKQGHQVINNVRWGTEETFSYSFTGIPKHSMVCIGTVGSGLRLLENRPVFEQGLEKMIEVLQPHTVIIYGSAKYRSLDTLREKGIRVLQFDSATSRRFKGGDQDE